VAEFASLTDLKAHLNLSSSTVDDGELDDILQAADDLVRSMVGSFDAVAVTERVAVHGGTALLSRAPAGAVTVTDYYGNAVAGAVVNGPARLLQYVPPTYGPVTVTYSAGDGVVPAAVRLATLVIAAHLYETQTRPGFTASVPAGFGGLDGVPDASMVSSRGFAIPHRAQELLTPYIVGTQIA
jgi:hypothetical protein